MQHPALLLSSTPRPLYLPLAVVAQFLVHQDAHNAPSVCAWTTYAAPSEQPSTHNAVYNSEHADWALVHWWYHHLTIEQVKTLSEQPQLSAS
jgi:hypothetical protein